MLPLYVSCDGRQLHTESIQVLIIFYCLWPTADQVALREEGIEPTSRVFFMDSSHRVSRHLLDSDVPSVNFRGLMDPVRSVL